MLYQFSKINGFMDDLHFLKASVQYVAEHRGYIFPHTGKNQKSTVDQVKYKGRRIWGWILESRITHLYTIYNWFMCTLSYLTPGAIGTSKFNPSLVNPSGNIWYIRFALFHQIHFLSSPYVCNDPMWLSTLFIFFLDMWFGLNEIRHLFSFFFYSNELDFATVLWLIQKKLTLLSACVCVVVVFFPLRLFLFTEELEIRPIRNPFNHGFNQAHGGWRREEG